MDGPSLEQSDSDSGESWTLLENNSVYADDAPDFIDDQPKGEAQHHEKDEDTDGISIISDSDHETPSPTVDHSVFEKCHLVENLQAVPDIPEYDPTTPVLPNVEDDVQEIGKSNEFLVDSHSRHKTYVHRRNKRLSTVLNIIVLGSVITAAGVAIGHMWGAKNDCTMHTTSSVNKILSNLYKLQEENAYLRSKLKELTFVNNRQLQQQKIQPKLNKCRRVFEESLNNKEPRKLTKCVDENYHNFDNLMGHLVTPKFEKEFVGDIDKLKTVYLQNKSWLDDEISRRLKIEEELLKKYKNELHSAKEQNKEFLGEKDNVALKYSKSKNPSNKETLNDFENPSKEYNYNLQKKVTYSDTVETTPHPNMKPDENRDTEIGGNDDWFKSKHNINNVNEIKSDLTWNEQANQNLKSESDHDHDDNSFMNNYNTEIKKSAQQNNHDNKVESKFSDDWTEVKPKFRRNEERYENHYDNTFAEYKLQNEGKLQQENIDNKIENKPKFLEENRFITNDNSWSNRAQETKNKDKQEKGDSKESSDSWKDKSKEDRVLENVSNEDIVKDDRYVVTKFKQDKKRKGYVNSNKKQKRKNKNDKWNIKGEFGEGFEILSTPDDFILNFGNKNENDFDHISFVSNLDNINRVMDAYKEQMEKAEKVKVKEEKLNKKLDNKEQGSDWFEKRAVFRTEARKKYYEQNGDSSPNNSSWYFRRMRKREQCRAKGDNSTFRKMYKEKKNNKVKH